MVGTTPGGTLEFASLAANHGVTIVTLPAHTADALQPLDPPIFGSLKQGYKYEVLKLCRVRRGEASVSAELAWEPPVSTPFVMPGSVRLILLSTSHSVNGLMTWCQWVHDKADLGPVRGRRANLLIRDFKHAQRIRRCRPDYGRYRRSPLSAPVLQIFLLNQRRKHDSVVQGDHEGCVPAPGSTTSARA